MLELFRDVLKRGRGSMAAERAFFGAFLTTRPGCREGVRGRMLNLHGAAALRYGASSFVVTARTPGVAQGTRALLAGAGVRAHGRPQLRGATRLFLVPSAHCCSGECHRRLKDNRDSLKYATRAAALCHQLHGEFSEPHARWYSTRAPALTSERCNKTGATFSASCTPTWASSTRPRR